MVSYQKWKFISFICSCRIDKEIIINGEVVRHRKRQRERAGKQSSRAVGKSKAVEKQTSRKKNKNETKSMETLSLKLNLIETEGSVQ